MITIQAQWNSFEKTAVFQDAPPIQRKVMKLAFYAGAEAMMRINFAVVHDSISEEAGFHILNGCHIECLEFADQVAEGKTQERQHD